MKSSIYGLLPDELAGFCKEQEQLVFRAKQILDWLYAKRVASFDEMKNLPAALRCALAENFSIQSASIIEISGNAGETQKLLMELADGELIEAVIIPSARRDRNTVCLSSQVGCAFHCAFCASGQKGKIRDLSAGEMIGELMACANLLGERPDNVVFMGIGEPFDNYDETLRAVRIMNHADGLGIGARRITVSTCGVVPGIQKLSEEKIQIELSVSLHAPDSEIRSALMPVNRRWPFNELLAACETYTEKTKRIITFEYTLIRNVNDSAAHAHTLADALKKFPCRVNLIPLSPVKEYTGERAETETMKTFLHILEKNGINTTFRDSKGSALKAACGQLRSQRI